MGFGRKVDDTTLAGINKRGLVKTTSTVTSVIGYTAVPIVDGIPYYKNDNTEYVAFTGTDGSKAGEAGLVPAPATTDKEKFLAATGSWTTIPKYSNVVGATSSSDGADGLVPGAKAGQEGYFLTGDGQWTQVVVDSALSSTSTNALQNKVINTALSNKVDKTITVNSKALSSNVTLTYSDVGAVPDTRTVNGKALNADITLSYTDVNAVPDTRTVNGKALSSNISLTYSDVNAIPASDKGTAGGVAELDSDGKVPAAQLPSYVDDVIEGTLSNGTTFKVDGTTVTGETGKIYVDTTTNITYRWSGTQYTEISASLALGETSSTAYYGDKGKIAYDHSQTTHAPTTDATSTARGIMSAEDKAKLDGIESGANKYTLPTASSTLGGVKTTSTVSDATGYIPVPIINGIPYYKNDNTTYTASDGITLDGTTFKHTNSITAGTASGSATSTLDYSGTFTIPSITYDAQGHITKKSTTTLTLPDKVTNAETIDLGTPDVLQSGTYYLIGTKGSGSATALSRMEVSVVDNNTVVANTFRGALEGNADTATRLYDGTDNIDAGNSTTPVYFKNGQPYATTYYDPTRDLTVAIPITGWTSIEGNGYSYYTTISVTDIRATDTPTMSLSPNGIVATEDEMDQYDLIVAVATAYGYITVYATEVPTASINIILHAVPNRSKYILNTSSDVLSQ